MKTLNIILLILMMFVPLWSPLLYGGSESRRGTAGALELLLPADARSSALSGTLNSSITGVEAINWNPAGVGRLVGTEAMFSRYDYIADIKMSFAGVAVNFGGTGTFGFSVRAMDFGDIPVTTVTQPEGTGSTFSPNYAVFGLTYSNRLTERISGGVNIKYVTEKITRSSATGMAFDLGIQYHSTTGITLGVVLRNLGPSMNYTGDDMEYYTPVPVQEPGSVSRPLRLSGAEYELPSTLEIGIGYEFAFTEQHTLGISANFQNSNFGSDEYRFGAEYAWNDIIFFRGGYSRVSNMDNYLYGPSAGIGVKIHVGVTTYIICDYAYRSVQRFNANQWVSVKLGI
jgi:hypothetical protein